MPWQESSPMDLRLGFIAEWHTGLWSMTELCADYAISRKTGYKWVDRFDACGSVADRSRRPHESPRTIAPAVAAVLLGLRRRHPRWGARKLLGVLRQRDPAVVWPRRSAVHALFKAQGLVPRARPRRHPVASPSPLTPAHAPNDVWTVDFKGHFRTGDGVYCYPLTVRDAWSRFVVRCDALPQPTLTRTRRQFTRAFAEWGLPARIRSDNGAPFASCGLAGLSRLAVWWIRLGIIPERIAPGHPEQNGSHEQFHAVLKADTARPPARDRAAQQRRFRRFVREYNQLRPHEALGDVPPATWYAASPRPLPSRLPTLEYPGHCEVRRVLGNGCLCWHNRLIFVSEALIDEDVAFEAVDEGLWTVRFASVVLGRFDERAGRIQRVAPFTTGRAPAGPPRA